LDINYSSEKKDEKIDKRKIKRKTHFLQIQRGRNTSADQKKSDEGALTY